MMTTQDKSSFKSLLEMSDKIAREELGDYYVIGASRMHNILDCLESGAKQIESLEKNNEKYWQHRNELLEQVSKLKYSLKMYESHMATMQRDAEKYLTPDDVQFSKDWLVSRILYHLDGPAQREVRTAAREALGEHDASCDCGECYDKAHLAALADRP